MISNSIHSISPYLTQSLQDYRAQLDRHQSSAEPTVTAQQNTPIAEQKFDATALENNRQLDRDVARQAAVQAYEIKQTHANVETYIKASSQSDESGLVASSPEPVDVYQASLTYSRRADLITAFEEARQPNSLGQVVNIVI